MAEYPLTDLRSVLTDVKDAKGLANEHYTSQVIFDEEKRSILFDSWAGVGFGKDVPNPGDVKPIWFLGMPLLLVRDHDGEIAVFQNTCRHRGMILIQEASNISKVMRCPYHSWCYGLDGELKATPHVGGPGHNKHEAIRNEDLGLYKVPSAIWHDVIFVNISANAPAFEVHAEKLIQRWSEFQQPLCHDDKHGSITLDVKTNWKLAVENYCESYHLPWIHPGLNSYSRLQDHYHIEQPGDFSGQGTLVYQQLKDEAGLSFPDFDNLGDQWDAGAEYIAMFPNVLFGVHRDHAYAIILEPKSLDHTLEHISLYYTESGASDARYEGLRKKNASLWNEIFKEDIFVVEGMQAGRHGALFDGGKFSPAMDGPTHTFHHWVADKLSTHRSQNQANQGSELPSS